MARWPLYQGRRPLSPDSCGKLNTDSINTNDCLPFLHTLWSISNQRTIQKAQEGGPHLPSMRFVPWVLLTRTKGPHWSLDCNILRRSNQLSVSGFLSSEGCLLSQYIALNNPLHRCWCACTAFLIGNGTHQVRDLASWVLPNPRGSRTHLP